MYFLIMKYSKNSRLAKMKNKIILLLLIAVATLFTSCTFIKVPSPQYSVQAETDGQIGSLTGESKAHFILMGLGQWGDSSVVKAVENSGGKYIRTVDQRIVNFLGFYGSYSTIVTTDNQE